MFDKKDIEQPNEEMNCEIKEVYLAPHTLPRAIAQESFFIPDNKKWKESDFHGLIIDKNVKEKIIDFLKEKMILAKTIFPDLQGLYLEASNMETGKSLLNEGNQYLSEGKYDVAIEKFQKAIKLNPSNYSAYGNWGLFLYKQRKYDEAIVKYQKVIELNPDDIIAYANWGIALYNQGKHDEAIKKYRKAIELNPNDDFAYDVRIKSLKVLERHEEANKLIEKWESIKRKNNNSTLSGN